MGDGDYLFAFQQVVMPIAQEFNPDLVISMLLTGLVKMSFRLTHPSCLWIRRRRGRRARRMLRDPGLLCRDDTHVDDAGGRKGFRVLRG